MLKLFSIFKKEEPILFRRKTEPKSKRKKSLILNDIDFYSMDKENLSRVIGDTKKHQTLGDKLKSFMTDYGFTVSDLSEETGIEEKRIQEIRNNKVNHPKLNRIIAICLALELPYIECIDIVFSAGYNLRKDNELESLYNYFLINLNQLSKLSWDSGKPIVAICNAKLIELGHEPMTNLI